MKLFTFFGAFAATAAASLFDHTEGVLSGTILRPHTPPGLDLTDVFQLIPRLTHELHYRGEGSKENDGSAYGHMVSTFLHPTVILDHSSHISTVKCSGEGLDICFAGGFRLGDISDLWELTEDSPLIFSSFVPGCGQSDVGIRSYWRATGVSLSPNGQCVRVAAAEVPIDEAMSETEIEWGSVTMDATSPNNRRALLDDPKVDISEDQDALDEFFGVDVQNPEQGEGDHIGEIDQDGSDSPTKRSIQKRWWNPIEWAKGAINDVKQAVVSGAEWVVNKAEEAINVVVETGKQIGQAIADAAGHEWSISSSDEWKWKIGQPETVRDDVKTTKALFGVGEGLVISETGAMGTVSCEQCGASGTLTAKGAIAFSFTKGLTKGSIGVGGSFDATLQLAVKIEAQHKIPQFKKQLIGVNPTPFQIPGVLSLGPELTLNAALDIYYNGEAEFLVGATMSIDPGEATLDLLNKDGNAVRGFDARFEPIAKFRGGKFGVTADFGLPVGLEFGVNLFNGKFKKTIGLFDQPSIKVRAESDTGNEDCDGASIDVAVVNYIYLSAGGLYDYAIRTDELVKLDVSCVSAEPRGANRPISLPPGRKFSSLLDDDDDGPDAIDAVNATFGNNTAATQPPFQDPVDSGAVKINPDTGASYRVIMDLDETVIMVSGKEERVYLAPAGEKNADVGAPFASFPDVTENIVISDVYGGFLNYVPEEMEMTGVANLRSSPLTGVPVGSRSIALMEVYPDAGDDLVGMYMAADVREQNVYALAACRVENKGSRIYLVDLERDDPIERLSRNELRSTIVGGDVEECQAVFLTSNAHGLNMG